MESHIEDFLAERATHWVKLSETEKNLPKKDDEVLVLFIINYFPVIISARVTAVLKKQKIKIDQKVPEGGVVFLDKDGLCRVLEDDVIHSIIEGLKAKGDRVKWFFGRDIVPPDDPKKGLSDEVLNLARNNTKEIQKKFPPISSEDSGRREPPSRGRGRHGAFMESLRKTMAKSKGEDPEFG